MVSGYALTGRNNRASTDHGMAVSPPPGSPMGLWAQNARLYRHDHSCAGAGGTT